MQDEVSYVERDMTKVDVFWITLCVTVTITCLAVAAFMLTTIGADQAQPVAPRATPATYTAPAGTNR